MVWNDEPWSVVYSGHPASEEMLMMQSDSVLIFIYNAVTIYFDVLMGNQWEKKMMYDHICWFEEFVNQKMRGVKRAS